MSTAKEMIEAVVAGADPKHVILGEAFSVGAKDRKVLDAFSSKKSAEGNKLRTDGKRLDGLWMGGTGIAEWKNGKVVMHDLGSKAVDTVQKVLKKLVPSNMLQ